MNRGKSYRVLALMLLIAFISLISRSLIYLIISLTIAVIIIMLLSKDVKEKHDAKTRAKLNENEIEPVKKKGSGLIIPIAFTLLGVIMSSYGLTGIFELNTAFSQLNMMVEEPFILISAIVIGLLLALYGLILVVKKWLE